MSEAQGKKVPPPPLRPKAIEAQPPFGQIKPGRGPGFARVELHRDETRWQALV